MLRPCGDDLLIRRCPFVDGPDVLVLANPQEIKQVVLNLLVNALDSIDEDGEVCTHSQSRR